MAVEDAACDVDDAACDVDDAACDVDDAAACDVSCDAEHARGDRLRASSDVLVVKNSLLNTSSSANLVQTWRKS